jgi:hypothetical protein
MVVPRGIPTTINTPALDSVLMFDGRQPTLESQAIGAIRDHAQATNFPNGAELAALVKCETTRDFFSSPELKHFANGGPAPICRKATRRQKSAGAASSRTWSMSRIRSTDSARPVMPGRCSTRRNRFEDVLTQYTNFFQIVTNGAIQLTDQDRKDVVAFLKLLD